MPKGVYNRCSKRDTILQAAAKVYARYGFEGATIEKMAEEAGVSKSLVGEYFGGKQGLVKAVVEWAVAESLIRIREIDRTPGLTLRHRERQIHKFIAADREQWCLILGTILVPNFQFRERGKMAGILDATTQTVKAHLNEFRNPTHQFVESYSYSTLCLHWGYVIEGREDNFREAIEHLQDLYLLPEQEGGTP